jgi:hypothetical protein
MKRLLCTLFLAGLFLATASAQTPSIYIEPQGGFETYISAGLFKKRVPVTLASTEPGATYILRAGPVRVSEEKSGLGKLARCAFAYCIGIDGSQSVSVQLVDAHGDVVWAYSVRKVGAGNFQSSAEAIAKHLKEFLHH